MNLNAAMYSCKKGFLTTIERDEEGCFVDVSDWRPELVEPLAAVTRLELTAEHRHVIGYIREYVDRNLNVPEARVLLKHLANVWGEEKATRRCRYKLFPQGYGQPACKIAGMRKPRKLTLDV